MNSRTIVAACCLTLAAAGPLSLLVAAQQTPPPPATQPAPTDAAPATKGGWPTPEQTVARMSEKLNLTDDQKAKITPVIADRQAKMRALMADTSSRRLQKARQAKSIMSDSDKKIEDVLTKDQKKTYVQMKEEMKEQMRERIQERNNGAME